MTSIRSASRDADAIEEYRMHVSQRYLDLTRKKLELARLPRHIGQDDERNDLNDRKEHLESILDFWLETYDFRAQEAFLNSRLPQYRTHIDLSSQLDDQLSVSIRVHFVHQRSGQQDSIPLLFCHDWGSSFIEVAPSIEALSNPVNTPTPGRPEGGAFHVVCPSMPGFGYGDPTPSARSVVQSTAEMFGKLMGRLGYTRYIAYGVGWGFRVAQAVARQFSWSCKAVFTSNPLALAPTLRYHPLAWLKYHIARLTGARLPWFSFDYIPSDFEIDKEEEEDKSMVALADWSFALADSPTGLLSLFMQMIGPGPEVVRADSHVGESIHHARQLSRQTSVPWSPSDILTWTMLYWLSGPEAPLRWLKAAQEETQALERDQRSSTSTPVGLSFFRQSGPGLGRSLCPPAWTAAHCKVVWLRRHSVDRQIKWPAWEHPDGLVLDLRDFVADLQSRKLI